MVNITGTYGLRQNYIRSGSKRILDRSFKNKETAKYLLSNLPEKVLEPWKNQGRVESVTGNCIAWYTLVGNTYQIKNSNFNWSPIGSNEYKKFYNTTLFPFEKETYIDKKLQELGFILL